MKPCAVALQLLALLASAPELAAAAVHRSAAQSAGSVARSVSLRNNALQEAAAVAAPLATDADTSASFATRADKVEALIQLQGQALGAQQEALKVLVSQQAKLESQAQTLQDQEKKIAAELKEAKKEEPRFSLLPGMGGGLTVVEWLVFSSVYMLLVAIAATIYGNYFTYPYVEYQADDQPAFMGEFSFGLFDGLRCEPDWRICFFSCCCLPVRWADTMSSKKVRYMKFWPALIAIVLLQATISVSFGIAGIMLMILLVNGRQRIREIYGMPYGSCSTLMTDWAVWLFCSPCAAMQEAMEIELIDPNRHQVDYGMPQSAPFGVPQQRPMVPPLANMPGQNRAAKTAPQVRGTSPQMRAASPSLSATGKFGPLPREV